MQAHPETSPVSLGLLLSSAVVLPPLAIAKSRVAARLGSGALRADSILTAVAAVLAVIKPGQPGRGPGLAATRRFGH